MPSEARRPKKQVKSDTAISKKANCSANSLEKLQRCLDSAKPGETIELLPGQYQGKTPLIWSRSGTEQKPITLQGTGPEAKEGDWGRSVLKTYKKWPVISNFTMNFQGNDHITVKRLHVSSIAGNVAFKLRGTANVSISDLYVVGGGKNTTEVFSTFGGARELSLRRVYATQVGKRFLRGQPLIDAEITDTYADAMINGKPSNNWTFLYHFEDGSKNIKLNRTIGKNPAETSKKYHNGDCYASERNTSNIAFSKSWCFDAMDSGFDLKGINHKIDQAIVVRAGNYSYRIWNGPVQITNSAAVFGGKGQYTCTASHGYKSLWKKSKAVRVSGDSIIDIKPGQECFSKDKEVSRDSSVRNLEKNYGITLFR
jgi:hypothetical protein